MKTIFNTYIEIESQEQADRLKKVCIDNGLAYCDDDIAFKIMEDKDYFGYSIHMKSFAVWIGYHDDEIQVSEQEWMQLLKEYKS